MEFRAQDLFNITVGLMNEQKANSRSYEEFALPIINTVLIDLLGDENQLRIRDNQEKLEEAPYLTAMEDIIPYHRELIQNVMPYGVGLLFFQGDDEMTKATYFSTMYDRNRMKYSFADYVATGEVFNDGV